VANFLSQLHSPNDPNLVADNFPDENLFAIGVKTPWFADIANYLSSWKFPTQLSKKQK